MSPILRAAVGISLALAGYLCSTPSFAQQPFPPGCGPLSPLLEVLKQRYGQFRMLVLNLTDGKLVIAVSPKEGTWTVLKVEGQDAACIFAAGRTSLVDRGL